MPMKAILLLTFILKDPVDADVIDAFAIEADANVICADTDIIDAGVIVMMMLMLLLLDMKIVGGGAYTDVYRC